MADIDNTDEPLVNESSALLGDSSTSSNAHPHDQHRTTWYWPWEPRYWTVIPVIFLAGLSSGPRGALFAPFVKQMFCERGIPKYFPVQEFQDYTGSVGGDQPGSDPRCDSAQYSAAIANFTGITASIAACLCIVTIRFWSALGDRIGRKRVMLIWGIGTALSQCCTLLVYYQNFSLYWLWIASIIEGATGAILSLLALIYAYAADVTTPSQRTVVFGRLIAGWYGGLGLGAAMGGIIAREYGLIAVFWVMPAIILTDLVYIMMIPESLTPAALAKKSSMPSLATSESQTTIVAVDDETQRLSYSHDATKLKQSRLDAFMKSLLPDQLPRSLGGKHSVLTLMTGCFLAMSATMGAAYQVEPYLMYRFKWPVTKLSALSTVQGLSRLFLLTVLLPVIRRLLPAASPSDLAKNITSELKIVIAALVMDVAMMLIYALSPMGEGFYVGVVLGSIGSMFNPAMRSIFSQCVAPELLGKTLGTLGTFESLAAVIAPTAFSVLYGATLQIHPATVFFISAGLLAAALTLVLAVAAVHRRSLRRDA
ncbi:hypothetical protein BGZ99_004855 [Dissophora globulifera]|uniref:Major facilitator superfamily (MFS) profile domain-containing protein n=1 Tax=Dissophora globulifera TaxID=979702 RepID=A0A9P6UUI2_9FUNG|nr:hypothetical protein BGZ99_004855 [Dissophora globulifera]